MQYKGYTLYIGYQQNDRLRLSMDALAQATFGGLSFESWYQAGHWRGNVVPYSLFDCGQCMANVFVNPFTLRFDGCTLKAAQLGTVMTANSARGKGLSRFLIDRVIKDWLPKVDTIYLYANDSVVEFYPRFGFTKWIESDVTMTLPKGEGKLQKLDLKADRAWIDAKIAQGNPYARITVDERTDVSWFHLINWYRDCLYRLPERDALLVVTNGGGVTTVLDVFCSYEAPLAMLLDEALPAAGRVQLGFLPKNEISCEAMPSQEEDNHCFVLGDPYGLFSKQPVRLPVLCRT